MIIDLKFYYSGNKTSQFFKGNIKDDNKFKILYFKLKKSNFL